VLWDRREVRAVDQLFPLDLDPCQRTRAERTRLTITTVERFDGKATCENARERLKVTGGCCIENDGTPDALLNERRRLEGLEAKACAEAKRLVGAEQARANYKCEKLQRLVRSDRSCTTLTRPHATCRAE
jgi:hypothetical protein